MRLTSLALAAVAAIALLPFALAATPTTMFLPQPDDASNLAQRFTVQEQAGFAFFDLTPPISEGAVELKRLWHSVSRSSFWSTDAAELATVGRQKKDVSVL